MKISGRSLMCLLGAMRIIIIERVTNRMTNRPSMRPSFHRRESKHSQTYLTGWLAKQTMARSLMHLESKELSQVAVWNIMHQGRHERKTAVIT